jgi:hypothetical protein
MQLPKLLVRDVNGKLLNSSLDPAVTTPGVAGINPPIYPLAFFDQSADISGSGNLQWDEANSILNIIGKLKLVGSSLIQFPDGTTQNTSTAPSFTAGSIPFAGATGALTQNNANLFWDNTNLRLGIGTASPAVLLDLNRGSAPVAPSLSADKGTFAYYDTYSLMLQFGAYPSSPNALWMQTKHSTNDGSSYPLAINPLGGNVGIGTSSPSSLFSVGSSSQFQVNSSGQVAEYNGIATAANGVGVIVGADTRTGVTSVDASAITLYSVPASGGIFRFSGGLTVTALAGSGKVYYTQSETCLDGTTYPNTTSLSGVGTVIFELNTVRCKPSTNITGQITKDSGVTSFTAYPVCIVEQLA